MSGDLRFALGPRHYLKLAYRVQELFDGPLAYVDRDGGYVRGVAPAEFEIREYLLSVGFLSPPTVGNLLRAYLEVGGVLVFLGQSPLAVDLSVSATFKLSGGDGGEGSGVVTAVQAGLVLLLGRGY